MSLSLSLSLSPLLSLSLSLSLSSLLPSLCLSLYLSLPSLSLSVISVLDAFESHLEIRCTVFSWVAADDSADHCHIIRVADGHLAWERNLSAGPLSSSPSPRLFSHSVMGGARRQMMRDGERMMPTESQDLWVVSNNARCFYMAYDPKGHHQQGTTHNNGGHEAMIPSSEGPEKGTTSSDRVAEAAVADGAPVVEATVQMPESTFTSPVALDNWVFSGLPGRSCVLLGPKTNLIVAGRCFRNSFLTCFDA